MTEVELSKISLTGWNPRKSFAEDSMNDLIVSVQEHGILEPLLVRPDGNGGFQLVAGERRYRAALANELEKVPVVVKDMTDQQVREIMLLENLQREDLTALEEAEALRQLLEDGMTQQELAQRLGKSQPWVANRLRLLQTPSELRPHLISREISPKHMMILFRFKEYGPLFKFLRRKLKEYLEEEGAITVRGLEDKIETWIRYRATREHLVFELEPFSWEKDEWWDLIDFSDCSSCRHIYKDSDGNEYCLNRSCYANKSNIAKQKYEKKLEEQRKNQNGRVNTRNLGYDHWRYLSSVDFDKTECSGCEFKKLEDNALEREICINVPCFKKKQRVHTRKINDAKRDEEARVMKALDIHLMRKKKITNKELRDLLRFFAQVTHSVDHIKGMKKYGIKKWMDAYEIVDEVPDDELMTAVLRILYARLMVGRYSSGGREYISKEDLEREVPEAVKYFQAEGKV